MMISGTPVNLTFKYAMRPQENDPILTGYELGKVSLYVSGWATFLKVNLPAPVLGLPHIQT